MMSPGQRLRFWLTVLAALLVLVYVLRGVLLPFVAGLVVAYFLDPVADRLERLGLSRSLATAAITLSFFLTLGAILMLLAPLLEGQMMAFIHKLPGYADLIADRLDPIWREAKRRLSPGDLDRLRTGAGQYAGTVAAWALDFVKGLITGGMALVNILSLIFITPVVTFYILRDWDILIARIDGWLPRDHAPVIRDQLALIDRTLSGFLRGQATVCLILAGYYGAGLSLAGLEMGLAVGLSAGLLSFIPFVGSLSGIAAGLVLAYAQTLDWHLPALVALVFAIGQVLEGNVLTPKLVGDKVGLHPVWIMFALLAGGGLFGFVGILLAVPMAAIIGVLVRFALARYLDSPFFTGHA